MATVAIDWGGSRVGVAVSLSDQLASPHSILRNDENLLKGLCEIVEEHSPARIVLGLPDRERETSETRRIRELAERLERATGLKVVLWDESYSSIAAGEMRKSRKARVSRRPLDDEAAAVILQSWIDSGGPDHS